jgi:hypothetical protein
MRAKASWSKKEAHLLVRWALIMMRYPIFFATRLPFHTARGFASSGFPEFALTKWVYAILDPFVNTCQIKVSSTSPPTRPEASTCGGRSRFSCHSHRLQRIFAFAFNSCKTHDIGIFLGYGKRKNSILGAAIASIGILVDYISY